ncbi:MAG: hypothetical protein RLY86_3404, partial [Pseudomonadota bacterium]
IGTIDASTTSPDHAPAVDLATARRVEVVRGPATLLYGNNAVGGVINILDGRIPTALPSAGQRALMRLGYGANADEVLAAGAVDTAIGSQVVLHVSAFARDAGDYEVPGYVRSARLRALEEHDHGDEDHDEDHAHEEEARGRLENSGTAQTSGTAGLSVLGDWGFLGVSLSGLTSRYGLPVGHEHGHGEEHDEDHDEDHGHGHEDGVSIDLDQFRFDLAGEIQGEFLAFETTRLRFGHADYEHVELEGDEVGTRFLNEGWEGRVELVQKKAASFGGDWSGAIGFQSSGRDFDARGEEAFVPPSKTAQIGAFTMQQVDLGALSIQAGARIERQTIESDAVAFDRDFTGISLSAGAGYTLPGGWLIGASLARTERAPNAEELLSDGPHLATATYEVGDPTLGEETAHSVEGTLKYADDRRFGALNLFYTDYSDFIYEAFTGAEEDDLPVARFRAADARFWGVEVEVGTTLAAGPGTVTLDGAVEYVRATDRDADRPIPRIPPLSARATLGYELAEIAGRLELVWADDQGREGPFELETQGYTVLNAALDWHPFGGDAVTLLAEVRNLTDEEVRHSTSFLKDQLAQPGRDYRLSLRAAF